MFSTGDELSIYVQLSLEWFDPVPLHIEMTCAFHQKKNKKQEINQILGFASDIFFLLFSVLYFPFLHRDNNEIVSMQKDVHLRAVKMGSIQCGLGGVLLKTKTESCKKAFDR